jgi:hypothetical protein
VAERRVANVGFSVRRGGSEIAVPRRRISALELDLCFEMGITGEGFVS